MALAGLASHSQCESVPLLDHAAVGPFPGPQAPGLDMTEVIALMNELEELGSCRWRAALHAHAQC